MKILKVGIIGLGRMGGFFLNEFLKSDRWQVTKICEPDTTRHEEIAKRAPEAELVVDEDDVLTDPEVDVVVLSALADTRLRQIEKAVSYNKHIISEKPIGDTPENEWKAVELVENAPIRATVNLYLRNSWYLQELIKVADSGELGEIAVVRLCHNTPGLSPGEGHEAEGPAFHDCGMHYCDAAHAIVGSDFKTYHAQAVRFWAYKDPWWLEAHGTFENGVAFDITQGHVYGQLSAVQTHNSYMEIIGTKGIARMTHDFKTAVVDIHGVTRTERIERPYGGKNIDKLIELMADSIESGVRSRHLPTFREAAMASEFAWKCLDNARQNDLPVRGTAEELEQIHQRRATMTDGYGLLRKQTTH
ncbi:MAG: Gfo/Idh/MocA family oxidoreductase [Muribaculaceae bacterium]|nr:Gfo/Idh/MocA family oxidoreductase [Muribaculaceae bacterium]